MSRIYNPKFFILFFLPIILVFTPYSWFEKGHSICLIKNIFDKECLGCGITRAVILVLKLEFKSAWNHNKLIVIVFPILVHYWFSELQKCVIKETQK